MSTRDAAETDADRDPLDLLAEQFLQRVRRGEAVTPESFAAAHAEHAGPLRELLPTLLLLEQAKRERESTASGGRRLAIPQLQRLGDYRIVREVGRGGMGVVFEAVQEALGRRVALKVLPQASLLTGNQLERFRREARTAAGLHHTHIVPVFDSGEADGFHYYAMQFIDGRSLDAIVREQRAASRDSGELRAQFRLAARIGAEVADALEHAHAHGTLHRDIKPANLLLDDQQHVWVTDFGLAKALQAEGLTLSGDVLGTLQYMAPEQFAGQYDARSEVYALGATVYELIAARPAFAAATRSELIDRIRAGRCERLRRQVPAVPRDLETIVGRAMALEPKARYASARELGDDLRAFLAEQPIAARRQSATERVVHWCRRNRALATAGGVAILAVLAAAVIGWSAYLVTADALLRTNESAAAAQRASDRDQANLKDTLQVFEDVFDTLVGPDPLHALSDEGEGTAEAAMRAPLDEDTLALLERMLEFYDKFAERNADSVALREQTARAHGRVGAIEARLGELDDAVAAYEKALQRFRLVGDRDVTRDVAGLQQELGQVQVRRRQPVAAAECFAQSLKLLEQNTADSGRSARRLQARAHFLLATVREFRGDRPGGGPEGRRRGAGPLGRRGAAGEPRPGDNRPPEGPRPRPGELLFDRLTAEARGHLDAALALLSGLLAEQPDDLDSQFLQARCLLAYGRRVPRRDPAGGPGDEEQRGLAILRHLVEQRPGTLAYRFELGEALVALPRGRPGDDLERLQEAEGHARQLLARQPTHPEFRALLGRCLSQLGSSRHDRDGAGDPQAGRADLEAALAIQQALAGSDVDAEGRFAVDELQTLRRLVRVQFESRDEVAARATAQQLFAHARDLFTRLRESGRPIRPGEEGGRPGELLPLLERLGLHDEVAQLRKLLEPRGR